MKKVLNYTTNSEITQKTSSQQGREITSNRQAITRRTDCVNAFSDFWNKSDLVLRTLDFSDSRTLLKVRYLSKSCYNICEELRGLMLMRKHFQIPYSWNDLVNLPALGIKGSIQNRISCFLYELINSKAKENREKIEFVRQHTGIDLKIKDKQELSQLAQLISKNSNELANFNGHKITGLDLSDINIDHSTLSDINDILDFISKNPNIFQLTALTLGTIDNSTKYPIENVLSFFAKNRSTNPLTKLNIKKMYADMDLRCFSDLQELRLHFYKNKINKTLLPLNGLSKLGFDCVHGDNVFQVNEVLDRIDPTQLTELKFGYVMCNWEWLNLRCFKNVEKLEIQQIDYWNKKEQNAGLAYIAKNLNICELRFDIIEGGDDVNLQDFKKLENLKITNLNGKITLKNLENLKKVEVGFLSFYGHLNFECATFLDPSNSLAVKKIDFGTVSEATVSEGTVIDLSTVLLSKELNQITWTEIKPGAKVKVLLPASTDMLAAVIRDRKMSLLKDVIKLQLLLNWNLLKLNMLLKRDQIVGIIRLQLLELYKIIDIIKLNMALIWDFLLINNRIINSLILSSVSLALIYYLSNNHLMQ